MNNEHLGAGANDVNMDRPSAGNAKPGPLYCNSEPYIIIDPFQYKPGPLDSQLITSLLGFVFGFAVAWVIFR